MTLADTLRQVVEDAGRLRAARRAANEANTKAALIEPILEALGWKLRDFEQVDREYRVFDGTLLDYALKVSGEKRLFVEAKALTEGLDNPQFVSQTVNYANNEGVQWCVLTNGLTWRVYKTNELVDMPRKLLFEETLTESEPSESARSLQRISRQSVEEGELDRLGEQVFTDTRVRAALAELATNPPRTVLDALSGPLGRPPVEDDALRASLGRVLGASGARPKPAGQGTKPPDTSPTVKGKDYPLDHHTGGKPAEIVNLFQELDDFTRSLGTDVTRRVRKFYVGYFEGKRSFCTIELQRARIIIYLNLPPDPTQAWWNAGLLRDVTNIGHYGMGDTEFSLTATDQVEAAKKLIRNAYNRARTLQTG